MKRAHWKRRVAYRLAAEANCDVRTVNRWIAGDDVNGMTTALLQRLVVELSASADRRRDSTWSDLWGELKTHMELS